MDLLFRFFIEIEANLNDSCPFNTYVIWQPLRLNYILSNERQDHCRCVDIFAHTSERTRLHLQEVVRCFHFSYNVKEIQTCVCDTNR